MQYKWSGHGSTTVTRALDEACAKWPDKVFLDFSGKTHTYAEVDREATRLAHGLTALGLCSGDRVCAILDNVSDFVFAIEHGIPEVHTLVSRGALPEARTRLAIRTLDSIRSADTTPIASSRRPGDLAMLLYTSGTTGPSKGCMMSHNYVCNIARQCGAVTYLAAEDVLWTPCPMFHVTGAFGGVLNALLVGATAAISPRFSAANTWPEIERSRATVIQLVSVMLSIVADAPDTDAARRCYGQVRTLYGAPLNAKLIAKWKDRFGLKYVAAPLYGMTEACMVTQAPVDTPNVPDGASGRRTEEFDVRIVDDDGNECPSGVPGEIIVRPRKPDIMFQGNGNKP